MSLRGKLAQLILAAQRRAGGALRTWAARETAQLAPGSRLLASAAVYNIRSLRSAVQVGAGSVIAGELLTFAHGGKISIGSWCFVGASSRIWSAASIDIGDRVLISHNVNIHDCDSHPRDPAERHRQFVAISTHGHPADISSIDAAPIRIGADAWIGFNATILKGVSIGARSIVAAGSIVTKSMPEDSIWIGGEIRNPTT
jgi:acetyltransferase-like isoleucine patch superfamily enzyme